MNPRKLSELADQILQSHTELLSEGNGAPGNPRIKDKVSKKDAAQFLKTLLPEPAIAELRLVMPLDIVNVTAAEKRKKKIEDIIKRYNLPTKFQDIPTWYVIVRNFFDVFGRSLFA